MTDRRWLVLILLFYVLLGAGYSVAIPIWEAPDEPAHYRYALTLAQEGRLPTLEDTYEARQPPGYYLIAAALLAVVETARPGTTDMYTPSFDSDNIGKPAPVFDWHEGNYEPALIVAPLLLRWLGVAAGVVALLLIYHGARRLFPEWPFVAPATTALAAGTPQFVHITASVNNDVLAIVAGALLFWVLVIIANGADAPEAESPPGKARRLLLRLLLAAHAALFLPLLVKLTVLPVGLALLLVTGWQVWRRWRGSSSGRRRTVAVAAVALFTLPAGAFFLLATMPGRHLLEEFSWRLFYLRPDFWEPVAIFERSAQTYWGAVGWAAVRLPQPFVHAVVTLALVGAAAGVRPLLPLPAPLQPSRRRPWRLLWPIVILAVVIFVRNTFATPSIQGRFFFPVIGPLSLLVVGGWASLLPGRARSALLPAALLLVFLLNLALWETGIRPVYYQPWLD